MAAARRADYVAFLFRVPFALDAYRLGFFTGVREDYSLQIQHEDLDLPVLMLDNDFRDPDLERYLEVFETHRPLVGVIGDADDSDQADELVATARDLQERLPGFEPLLVPKCREALERIPEDLVVGYPIGYSDVQARDFSGPADWAGRRIHILGGTPPRQWEAIQCLTGCGYHGTTLTDFGDCDPDPQADVVGLDWNGLHRVAMKGEYWYHQSPHWRPADACSIRATVRRGLWHIREFRRERGVWPETTPMDVLGTAVLDGPLSARYTHCERCGHRLADPAFELVEYDDGTARGFCSDSCRSWLEYHDGL